MSSPSSLRDRRSTKVLEATEAQVLAAWILDGDFGWGTSGDLHGLSSRDVRGALLSSIVFRMTGLSTHFSTVDTTSLRSTLHTSVIMRSNALSIMFFCSEIKLSCLPWSSLRSLAIQPFSLETYSRCPFKVPISWMSFSSRNRRLWISLFSF